MCRGEGAKWVLPPPPFPLSTPPPSPVHVKDANWGKTRERNVFSFRAPFPEKRSLRKEFFAHYTQCTVHILPLSEVRYKAISDLNAIDHNLFSNIRIPRFLPFISVSGFFWGGRSTMLAHKVFFIVGIPNSGPSHISRRHPPPARFSLFFLGKKETFDLVAAFGILIQKDPIAFPPPKRKGKNPAAGLTILFFFYGKTRNSGVYSPKIAFARPLSHLRARNRFLPKYRKREKRTKI